MVKKEVEILLPKLGESIVDATIVQWLKKEGDFVQKDEALLEVSTDKVNSEIPSPVSGIVKTILALPEEEKKVGDLLAIITLEEESSKEIEKSPKTIPSEKSQDFYSPAVMQLAKQNHISLDELEKIPGTGNEGRITKKDILNYLESKTSRAIPMTPMRKAIAQNVTKSFFSAPHASLITEVDVTDLLDRIKKEKDAFFEKHQSKLSITAFVALAIAKTLPSFAYLNSSCDMEKIELKEDVNIGVAVHVEEGVLVPIIKKAQEMDIIKIAKSIFLLAKKARSDQLKAEEMQEGTVTLTNYGFAGIDLGLPIIRHREAAIIGMGAVKLKPVAMDNEVVIRSIMNLSLTFDHRVCDGIYGCSFLNQLKTFLENYND